MIKGCTHWIDLAYIRKQKEQLEFGRQNPQESWPTKQVGKAEAKANGREQVLVAKETDSGRRHVRNCGCFNCV